MNQSHWVIHDSLGPYELPLNSIFNRKRLFNGLVLVIFTITTACRPFSTLGKPRSSAQGSGNHKEDSLKALKILEFCHLVIFKRLNEIKPASGLKDLPSES